MKDKIIFILYKLKLMNIAKMFWFYLDCILLIFIKKSKIKSNKKQVLLLCSFGVGDGILFISTIDKYRKLYPKKDYEITVLCTSKTKMLFETETDFDYVIELNIDEAVSSVKKRYALYKKINEKHYDILIDTLGPSAIMGVYTSHASYASRKIVLVNETDIACPKRMLKKSYNEIHYIKNINSNTVSYFNELVNQLLGINNKIIKFHQTKNCELPFSLPEKYFIVFPSASTNTRKWEPEKFAEIINRIYKKINIPVVFTGTKSDAIAIDNVINSLDKKVEYYNITEKTSLMEFIELIKKSSFVITNDTGAYHIAISENIPVTVIAGGYTFNKYIKYDNTFEKGYRKPYIVSFNWKCFNCKCVCDKMKMDDKIFPCLENIDVEKAWKVINEMIDNNYEGEKYGRKNKCNNRRTNK